MDVARLNFSHGDHAEHGRRYQEIRQAAEAAGRNVAVLADLQGPKIRLGRFAGGPVDWLTGERIRITVEECEGTHDRVSTTYKHLADDVRPGDRLLVDDGNVALVAVEVQNGIDVVCDVTEGGRVSNNKGLSLPGVAVSVPAMSDKDADDLEFALRLGVDFVALSFVRGPEDVKLVQQVMTSVGVHRPVIAKIEKPEAVERLAEIVLAFDGVMVARGDLGVEMPLEQVPLVQKRAVQICRDNAKPVIVATQMLESMITPLAPDPGRGVRRGQRGARRCRRGHAVRRDERRHLPGAGRRDDGAHHQLRRGVGHARPGPPAHSAHVRRARSSRPPRTSAMRWARWPWWPSPKPGTPRGGCRDCIRPSGSWSSRLTRMCSARWLYCGGPRHTWSGRFARPTRWSVRSTRLSCNVVSAIWTISSSSSPARRRRRPERRTRSVCTTSGMSCNVTADAEIALVENQPVVDALVDLLDLETDRAGRLPRAESADLLAARVRRPSCRAGACRGGAHRRAGAGRALLALLLHPPWRSCGPDPLPGRPGTGRAVVHHPSRGGRPARQDDLHSRRPRSSSAQGGIDHQLPMPEVPAPETLPTLQERYEGYEQLAAASTPGFRSRSTSAMSTTRRGSSGRTARANMPRTACGCAPRGRCPTTRCCTCAC